MTRFEDLISKTPGEGGLSPEERKRMRSLLSEYAAFKPVAEPFRRPAKKRFSLLRHPALASAFMLLIVALGTSGATYAAEGSVPGDTLYPIKVDVTEPVVTALTPTGKAQVTWQLTIARRRLDEVSKLKSEGRLASSTEASLSSQAANATLEGATLATTLHGVFATSSATSTASSTAALIRASKLLLEGRSKLKGHDSQGASRAFRASIHAAAHLEELHQTAGDFDLDEDDDNATSSPDGQVEGTSTQATSTPNVSGKNHGHTGKERVEVTATSTINVLGGEDRD